jgi:predicted AAA+ superfamily ATPase
LCLTKIISKCVSITNDNPDSIPVETKNFKLFFNDTGLFLALFNNYQYYLGLKHIDSKVIGFIKENYAANCLVRDNQKLYYFLKQRRIKFENTGAGLYKKISYVVGSDIDFFS